MKSFNIKIMFLYSDGKTKGLEDGCSQTDLQETENCSATKRPFAVLDVPDTEAPARKKRKGAEEQPRRRSLRQRKEIKPGKFIAQIALIIDTSF